MMRKKACAVIVVLPVVAFLLSGCATYVRNRTADLADIISAEASVGRGAHLNIQVTDFIGTGLGFSKQHGIAIHGRYIGASTRESGGLVVMNISGVERTGTQMRPLFAGGRSYADMQRDCIHIYDDTRGSMWFIVPMDLAWNGPSLYRDSARERWWRILDVSVGASAIAGFHICLSPGEIVDFVLGLAGLDMAGDDVKSVETPQRSNEASNHTSDGIRQPAAVPPVFWTGS